MNISKTVTAAQNGDKKALEKLYTMYYSEILCIARDVLYDEDESQDAAQDAFLAMIEKLPTLRCPEAFHQWLKKIVINRCLILKRNKHDFVTEEDGKTDIETMSNTENGEYISLLPHAKLDKKETLRLIHEIVLSLSEKHRTVILMYYYAEMSVEEIAAELKISSGTVKSRLSYARKAVEKQIRVYEEQGIKLYNIDTFENFRSVIQYASKLLKPSHSFRDIMQASSSAASSATGDMISAHTANMISTHTANLVSTHVANTVSQSVASKISIGISAAIAMTAICITGLPGISSASNSSQNQEPSAVVEESPSDNFSDNNTDTVNIPPVQNSDDDSSGIVRTEYIYLPGEQSTVYVQGENTVEYLPADTVIKTQTEHTVEYLPGEDTVVTIYTDSMPKDRSVYHDIITDDGFIYRIYDNCGEALLLDYPEKKYTDLILPDTVTETINGEEKTIRVTEIDAYIFSQDKILQTVKLPSGLSKIPNCAFYYVPTLKAVDFNNNITEIGDEAFYGCSSLTSIPSVPNLRTIGKSAFENCKHLHSFTFERYLESIEDSAFKNSGLTEAILPEGLRTLGNEVFSGSDVQKASIPDSLLSVDDYCFKQCEKLSELTVPYHSPDSPINNSIYEYDTISYNIGKMYCDNLKNTCIGKHTTTISVLNIVYSGKEPVAFEGKNYNDLMLCSETIRLEGNFSSIAENAFSDIFLTKSIILPDSVTEIGNKAFYSCWELASVVLPSKLEYIGDNAFDECRCLINVTSNAENVRFGENVFESTPWFEAQRSGPVYVGDVFYTVKSGRDTDGKHILVPDKTASLTLEDVDTYTGGSSSDEKIYLYIPDSVSEIDSSIYFYRNNIYIQPRKSSPYFTVKDGVLFSKDMTKLLHYPSFIESQSYTVPEQVTEIGENAFKGAKHLIYISMSDSVRKIGARAFWGADNLESIILSNSIRTISSETFAFDFKLKKIIIPDSVQTIHSRAFYCNKALKHIKIGKSVSVIGKKAFAYNRSLKCIHIPANVKTIYENAFYCCNKLWEFIYDTEYEDAFWEPNHYDEDFGYEDIGEDEIDDFDWDLDFEIDDCLRESNEEDYDEYYNDEDLINEDYDEYYIDEDLIDEDDEENDWIYEDDEEDDWIYEDDDYEYQD